MFREGQMVRCVRPDVYDREYVNPGDLVVVKHHVIPSVFRDTEDRVFWAARFEPVTDDWTEGYEGQRPAAEEPKVEREFQVGDVVRVVGHWRSGFTQDNPRALPVGSEWVVDALGQINGWVVPGCHKFELVTAVEDLQQAAPVEMETDFGCASGSTALAREVGLEFLTDRLMERQGWFHPTNQSEPWVRGYKAAMDDLAAAYGKKIQHVNRMELVDA